MFIWNIKLRLFYWKSIILHTHTHTHTHTQSHIFNSEFICIKRPLLKNHTPLGAYYKNNCQQNLTDVRTSKSNWCADVMPEHVYSLLGAMRIMCALRCNTLYTNKTGVPAQRIYSKLKAGQSLPNDPSHWPPSFPPYPFLGLLTLHCSLLSQLQL